MTPQILCENVSVQYDRHPAVQNATFSVEPGDFLCIVGENGSGKSTLLKAMLGLLPLSGGQILFPDSRSRRGIGYVPQQSNIQKNFPATVWEIVLSGCLPRRKWRPFYTAADKQRAQDALSRVDMLSLKNISYQHLSGGQEDQVHQQQAAGHRVHAGAVPHLFVRQGAVTGPGPDGAGKV